MGPDKLIYFFSTLFCGIDGQKNHYFDHLMGAPQKKQVKKRLSGKACAHFFA
jgi:hypothetical protein